MTEPTDQTRRLMLRTAVASFGVALAACGGGAGTPEAEAASRPTGSGGGGGGSQPSPPPSPPPSSAPGSPPPPSPPPPPLPAPPVFTWWISPGQLVFSTAGSTVVLASGATGMSVRVSPDLPGGRTVTVSSAGLVTLVAPEGVPAVELSGPWAIEVFS